MFTDVNSFNLPIRVASISICEVNLPVKIDIIYFYSFGIPHKGRSPVATDKVDSD